MGISVPEIALMNAQERLSDLNYRSMAISNKLMMMQNEYSNYINYVNSSHDMEMEMIEMQFEGNCQDLEAISSDYKNSEEYTEMYQEYLDFKERAEENYERGIEEAQRNYDRQEQQIDMEKEQVETQAEAVKADKESYESLLDKNVKEEFTYFD